MVIAKAVTGKLAKTLILTVFVLIPTWDIIPGQLYFNHLCEKEAGIKVFRTVEMEKEYFLPNGQPDEKKLAGRYSRDFRLDKDFSPLFHIAKRESVIQNVQTGDVLGTATDFSYRGGWLTAFVLPEGPGTSCSAYPNLSLHSAIRHKVIKQKSASTQGEN